MADAHGPRRFSWPGGLPARLLLLTALFVMATELFVLIPSLAAFEADWLIGRVRAAALASLAVEASPGGGGSERMAGSSAGGGRLLLQGPHMTTMPELVHLRQADAAAWLAAPFATLAPGPARMLRVVAKPQFRGGDFVEIVVPEAPLKADLTAYMLRLLGVSVLVSIIAGVMVFLTLNAFLVRPMQRITQAM